MWHEQKRLSSAYHCSFMEIYTATAFTRGSLSQQQEPTLRKKGGLEARARLLLGLLLLLFLGLRLGFGIYFMGHNPELQSPLGINAV